MTPFLSVVIPTFNRVDSLALTLEALRCQRDVPGDFEVVVVSDGSTDGTDALLAEWRLAKLPFAFKGVQQENLGPAQARNRGILEASGTVIVFLDDDVEPGPHCLANHARHHFADTQLVLIGPMSPDPKRARKEPVWIAWEHAMLQKQYQNWIDGTWAPDACGPHNFYTGNASVRRDHLLAVGGFDEGFTRQEDVELATRMEQRCGVYFRFDNTLEALHRPRRTFRSWLRVPYAYGRLDAIRARRGSLSWTKISSDFASRQALTRMLAKQALPHPVWSEVLRGFLRSWAQLAYAIPSRPTRRLGLAALSVLYNIHYLEGVRDELGSWDALRKVLSANQEVITNRRETTA